MARARVRLYEVRAVRKGEGLTLRDLWNEQVIEVRERLATEALATWDLLAVRIITGEHGHPVMEGSPWVFAPIDAPELLQYLRWLRRDLRRREPDLDDDTLFQEATLIFQDHWFDQVTTPPGVPELVTSDGEEMALVKVTFELSERVEQARIILREAGFDGEEGDLAWLEPNGRLLGRVSLQPRRLVLEVLSESRAREGRALLEKLLGPRVKHRSTVMEDPIHALGRAPGQAAPGPMAPDEAEAATAFLEQYYRSWLDEPIPALGGRTPRHAAKLKTQRPVLVSLLKYIEGGMFRQEAAGQPRIDLSFLWTELGITRD